LPALAVLAVVSGCGDSSDDGTAKSTVAEPADVAAKLAVAEAAAAPWTTRTFTQTIGDGSARPCVEVATAAVTEKTCLSLPGVMSWTVGGRHFVLSRSDIALSNGSTIRADADEVAIGLLPDDVLPTEDRSPCDRHELASAVAAYFAGASPAWVPVRCAIATVAGIEAVGGTIDPILLLAKSTDHWTVFARTSFPVSCAAMEQALRAKCSQLGISN
jgi:hypothetical protein